MILTLTLVNVLLLVVISGFHFYWAFGGTLAGNIVLPEISKGEKVFKPSKTATFVVAVILLVMSILPLEIIGLLTHLSSGFLFDYGLLILGSIFCLRGVGDFKYVGLFKRVKETKFAYYDTRYFSPLAFLMGLIFFVIDYLN